MEGYVLQPGAVDEIGRLPSLVYNLRTRSWGSLDAELRQGTVWQPPPPITQHALEAVAIKGRGTHEREAWETCPQLLLASQPWQITRAIEFSAIEQMVIVLVVRRLHVFSSLRCCTTQCCAYQMLIRRVAQRFLEHFTGMENTPYEWCVGGSILSTYMRRNAKGVSDEMHLVLCRKDDWAGNGGQKVGNTCKTCCEGIEIGNITLSGRVHGGITVYVVI